MNVNIDEEGFAFLCICWCVFFEYKERGKYFKKNM